VEVARYQIDISCFNEHLFSLVLGGSLELVLAISTNSNEPPRTRLNRCSLKHEISIWYLAISTNSNEPPRTGTSVGLLIEDLQGLVF
jgi:hypothetical protein